MREPVQCGCARRHVPLPMTYFTVKVNGETHLLCPTTYANLKELLTEFKIREGLPPGRVTKHYSRFVRKIALELWKESKRH
jgi:hypothetical protein